MRRDTPLDGLETADNGKRTERKSEHWPAQTAHSTGHGTILERVRKENLVGERPQPRLCREACRAVFA